MFLTVSIASFAACPVACESFFSRLSKDCCIGAISEETGSVTADVSDSDFFALLPIRFVKQKNAAMAIRAFASLRDACPRARLIVIGTGPEERRIREMARDMRISASFVGWTDDLASYYRAADMFVLASWYEGWGRTVVEAMAAGCLVVCTPVGCVPELVADGVNGYVVSQDDDAALARAIRRAYEHPAMRRAVAARGRETALSFSFDAAEAYAASYVSGLRAA